MGSCCLAKIKLVWFKPNLKNGVLAVEECSVNINSCDKESEATVADQKKEK